ncbi:DUF402 domain-containing protein [Ignisphaera sp. 4213-co]|uniref:DUF402 domain-containing protein n=1 Tax=Ignisphaera cupida TaxID=3050454 RepID=A0ABD4Z502_9CREN|nr:DUF402 domain-containing protein [Ignisphaera sp. 4213-co]MDK6028018.1 DUF402 domain-containing protein [Ignisphaera sp. 4213-co]
MYRYRVRGPYATALAKIIIDAGFELVDLSKNLALRLKMEEKSGVAPHATIKEGDEDPSTLIIVGYPDAVEALLYEIIARIPFTTFIYEELGPYTTISVKIKGFDRMGRCIGETVNGREVILQNIRECIEDAMAIAHIVKPSQKLRNGKAVALPGTAILKDTLVLLDDKGGRVYFSEHIRDFERKSLLNSLATQVTREGFSIRWRSSAKSAPLELIGKDLEIALNDAMKLRNISLKGPPSILYQGETIAFIKLTRASKEYLDIVRNSITPTTPNHHMLRTCRKSLDICVDLLDYATKNVGKGELDRTIKEFILSRSIGREITIMHEKPDYSHIEIGPIKIVDVVNTEMGLTLVGGRIIQRSGVYDGLGVEKRAGDIALTLIPFDEWFIVHSYLDQNGNEKGIYININTPPEYCPLDNVIKYLDLIIDVGIIGNNMKIIDLEMLEKAEKSGLLCEDLVYMANESVKKVVSFVDTIRRVLEVFRPLVKQFQVFQ